MPRYLVLLTVFALSCTTVNTATGAKGDSSTWKPPAAEDVPELATTPEHRDRFLADVSEYLSSPHGFLPALKGENQCPDLRDGVVNKMFEGRFSDVTWFKNVESFEFRIVSGDCPDGRLEGQVEIVGHYTGTAYWLLDTIITHADVYLRGEFRQGRLHGPVESYLFSAWDSGGQFAVFQYADVHGESLQEPATTFLVEPDRLRTFHRVEVEPGVVSELAFEGAELVGNLWLQDGKQHGQEVTFSDGQITRVRCFAFGERVWVDDCEPNGLPRGEAGWVLEAGVAENTDDASDDSEKTTTAAIPGVERARVQLDRKPAEKVAAETTTGESREETREPDTATAEQTVEPRKTFPNTSHGNEQPSAPSKVLWPELSASMKKIGGGEADAAVVVGIQDYAFVPDVPGASKAAKDWYRYFTRVRGTKPANVRLLLDVDATDDSIVAAAREMSGFVKEGGTLWFVFIGHGAPAKNQRDGLLVGVDAQQNPRGLFGRSVSQKQILDVADAGLQSRTILVVDACFSGRAADGTPLANGLQPLLPVETDFSRFEKKTLIFSAGQSDQFAGPIPELDRPAFSYLLLGGMLGWADGNGDQVVSAEELRGFSVETLRAVVSDRQQTPELYGPAQEPVSNSAGAEPPDIADIVLSQ